MTEKKQLLSEAQIRRMAAIAGIPALGTVSNIVTEKVTVDTDTNEETETTTEDTETTNEVADTEETTTEETEATNEEVVAEEEEMEMDAEAPAGEEVSQEKIESLVDAVLAAIEAETGVPAQRVDDEAPADDAPEMDAEEPEMEMGEEEPEEEVMETLEPSLAERIAAAVQTVLDEDAGLEESNCSTNEEEDVDEGYKMEEDEEEVEENTTTDEDTLDEITKAVVARLRSLK